MEDLVRLFLNNDSLLRIMTYMCRDGNDPIVNTVHVMLTSDIQFAVGIYGLRLFKNHKHVFPFVYMDGEQRHCLHQLVAHVVDKQHSAYASLENPLEFDVEDGHVVFRPVMKLPPRQVFDVLLVALQRSKRGSRLLCNILLQKLAAKMIVHKDMLEYIYGRCEELFSD